MCDDPVWERPRPIVESEHRPVLYRPDGTPLRRQIGFGMTQTSGTFPELTKRTPKGKGKKR